MNSNVKEYIPAFSCRDRFKPQENLYQNCLYVVSASGCNRYLDESGIQFVTIKGYICIQL
jgi:hypothetical protein